MASRSYDEPDVYTPTQVTYTKISGTGDPPTNTSSTAISRIKRGKYKGTPTPDFFRKQAEGLLLPLNYYYKWDLEQLQSPKLYYGTNNGPNPKYRYQSDGPSDPVIGMYMTSDLGVTQLLGKMSQGVNLTALQQKAFADIAPDLDLLTSMAEVGKTVSMILGVRKRALGLIRQALRGGFDTARAASKAWLEWRYGWRILGYDIENFCDFWNRPFRGEFLQGFAGTSVSEMETVSAHVTGSYVQFDHICDISRSLNVKVRAAVRYTGRNANVLASPVVTGWELIPLSFVGDWIVSVGDVLKAWSVLTQADQSYSSAGYSLQEDASMVRSNATLGSSSNAMAPFATSGNSSGRATALIRLPLGSPNFRPQLRVELNAGRIADAIALLIGFNKASGLRI